MDIILFKYGVLCGKKKSNNKTTLRLRSGRPCLQLTFLRVAFYIQRKSKALDNVYVCPFCHQSSQALSSDQKNQDMDTSGRNQLSQKAVSGWPLS